MKVKVKITPIVQLGASMYLPCAYFMHGVWRILTDYGAMETHQGDIKTSPYKKRSNLIFNTKTMSELVYEYESDPKLQSPNDKTIQKVVEVFWKNHPELTYNGRMHTNSKNPLYNLENTNEVVAIKTVTFKEKLAIQNKIAEMTIEQLRDVCDYYGISPVGKMEGELMVLLGDPQTGICTTGDNADKFKQVWMDISPDTQLLIVIKKAIRLGIIEQRKDANRTDYYLGNTFIGTDINDIISYCKKEDKIYQAHIYRKVTEQDTVGFEKVESGQAKEVERKVEQGQTTKTWSLEEIHGMRQTLYKLKDEGFVQRATPIHNLKPNTLVEKIKEAQELKEKKQAELVG